MGGLELDLITYALLLWNLGGVGVLSSQCWLAPAVLQQGQLVALAALCAYWFMFIPPCTTWLLVLCAVLYHVVTALSPHVPPPPGGSPPPSQMMFEAGPFAYGAHRCDFFLRFAHTPHGLSLNAKVKPNRMVGVSGVSWQSFHSRPHRLLPRPAFPASPRQFSTI